MVLGWNGEKEVERRRRGGSRERDMGMVLGWNGEKEEKKRRYGGSRRERWRNPHIP